MSQLRALRKTLFDPKVTDHRGRIVKNTGDGALAEFASVVDAVRCAVEVQRCMAEQNHDVPNVGLVLSIKISMIYSSEKRLRFMCWSLSWARTNFKLD